MAAPTMWQLLIENGWGKSLAEGIVLTLWLSLCSYGVSLILGFLGMMAKQSSSKILQKMAVFYTGVVRGLPELLIVLLLYYAVSSSIESLLIRLHWVSADFTFSPFLAAIMALGCVSGAYMTEVMRAAFVAIPHGQIESARALGMSPFHVTRRIILPQLMRYALPGMGNLWLVMIKESAIISVLGSYSELLYRGYIAAASTQRYLLFYSLTAGLFLMITLISLWILARINTHLTKGMMSK